MNDNANSPAHPVTRIETDMDYSRETEQHYPRTYTHSEGSGLTKREAFALACVDAAYAFYADGHCGEPHGEQSASALVAETAVQLADDLLAALETHRTGVKP